MFRKRYGRRPMRGGRRSKATFTTKHFRSQFTVSAANGSTITSPTSTDTLILTASNFAADMVQLIKDMRVARIIWQSMYRTTGIVAGVNASLTISEALYTDGLTATGVPSRLGSPFLGLNELNGSTPVETFPERIVFRWMTEMQVGAANIGPYNGSTADTQNRSPYPCVVVPRIRLDDTECLLHRCEIANPTANSISVVVDLMAAIVMETRF